MRCSGLEFSSVKDNRLVFILRIYRVDSPLRCFMFHEILRGSQMAVACFKRRLSLEAAIAERKAPRS